MKLEPNMVIAGRFRLNKLLGRGGMGSVWHATHLGLDIPCAVKFIEGEQAQSPDAQQRFEREAKAAAQLRSPHVVQILDHGISDGMPYIAMELLDGEDLSRRMQRAKRMDPKELVPIITQVCRALARAHALGIVHRDLKPDNVFLVRDDDREIAKVLDFGIAKNSTKLEGTSTKTGAMLGTPFYMSPEQAQGTKAVDIRADLWSLAVIVFQAICGKLPFESEALGDLLVRIIVAPIPVPSQVCPEVPPAFDKWWLKAAARDPGQRFQSAKEFAEALHAVWGTDQLTELERRNSGSGSGPTGTVMIADAGVGLPPTADARPPIDSFADASQPIARVVPHLARTFNGSELSATVPSKRGGVAALFVLLLAGLVGAGLIVMWVALRGPNTKSVAGDPLTPTRPVLQDAPLSLATTGSGPGDTVPAEPSAEPKMDPLPKTVSSTSPARKIQRGGPSGPAKPKATKDAGASLPPPPPPPPPATTVPPCYGEFCE